MSKTMRWTDQRPERPELPEEVTRLIADLVRVGTGEIEHTYYGECPEDGGDTASRAPGCEACKVLKRAEKLLRRSASGKSKA